MGRGRAALGAIKGTVDPYRTFLFILIVITISRIHQNFGWLKPLRPAFTLVIAAGIYAYLNPRYLNKDGVFTTWSGKVMLWMGISACLSVPFGISIGGSGAFILFEYSKTLLLAFLIVAGVRHSRDLYRLIWAFPVAAGALAYLSLFVFRMRTGSEGFARIAGGYTYDANDIALVVNVGAALTLLAYQVSRGKGKLACVIILGGLGSTLAKTGSRGGFLGFVALGLGVMALLRNVPVSKRLGFAGVALFGLLISAPEAYWEQMLTILHPTQDYNWSSPNGRREVFLRGLGYFQLNPVTGIGIDNFAKAEGTISDRAMARKTGESIEGLKWSVAHNSYLQAGAELGTVGLTVFLVLVFGGGYKAMQLRKRVPGHWFNGTSEERFLYYTSVYLPVAFFAFAVNCAFVSFAYMDVIYILAAYVAGLETSIRVKLKEDAGHGVPAGDAAPLPAVVAGPRTYRGGLPPAPVTGVLLPPRPQ